MSLIVLGTNTAVGAKSELVNEFDIYCILLPVVPSILEDVWSDDSFWSDSLSYCICPLLNELAFLSVGSWKSLSGCGFNTAKPV
jgi:hypothetical protein